MPYLAEIRQETPGCFLFLVDQSGSMDDSSNAPNWHRRAESVADAINQCLCKLVLKCAKSDGVRNYYHVGVIGYGLSVGSAFSGSLSERPLVPLVEIVDSFLRMDRRTKKVSDGEGGIMELEVKVPVWLDPVARGDARLNEALIVAYRILKEWIARNKTSYPPIVVNLTGGETDSDPSVAAQALTGLATADGNVLLCNWYFPDTIVPPVIFPDSESALLTEQGRRLFRMSSVLPQELCDAAIYEGFVVNSQSRAFASNADLIRLVEFPQIGARPADWFNRITRKS